MGDWFLLLGVFLIIFYLVFFNFGSLTFFVFGLALSFIIFWTTPIPSKEYILYNNSGFSYAELGEHEKAIEDYSKAIELNPKNAAVYNNRGISYRKLEEYKKAIEDYSKAIELEPGDADAYYNRAYSYRKLGEHEKALDNLCTCMHIHAYTCI